MVPGNAPTLFRRAEDKNERGQRVIAGPVRFYGGAPGEIRTPDHQVRSLVLYPTELRARVLLVRCVRGRTV